MISKRNRSWMMALAGSMALLLSPGCAEKPGKKPDDGKEDKDKKNKDKKNKKGKKGKEAGDDKGKADSKDNEK